MKAREDKDGAPPVRRYALKKKLLLALSAFVLLLLLMEVAARLYVPSWGPVRRGDGYYLNALPLITGVGGRPLELRNLPYGERLPEEKEEGEIRVFVLGESSVAGSPLDPSASMPAMLRDILGRTLPERRVTVINMGRSSSIAANVFYYLLFMGRYEPDYIIFYMGMNDADGMPGEQCAPLSSPTLHAVWRATVADSWALWLTRVFGPQLWWVLTDRQNWYPPETCPGRSFHLWADVLVETAQGLGAKVIAATPVISAATVIEPMELAEKEVDEVPPMTPEYRALLACQLSEGCDYEGELLEALREPLPEPVDAAVGEDEGEEEDEDDEEGSYGDIATDLLQIIEPKTWLEKHEEILGYRARSWRNAVAKHGGELVEFHRVAQKTSPLGFLARHYFADRQHLNPDGYYLLANLLAARIEAMITGRPERHVEPPADADWEPYLERTKHSGVEIALEQLVRGWYLTGAPGLRMVVKAYPPERCAKLGFCDDVKLARVAIGWLRELSGLDPALPPELAAELRTFKPLVELDRSRARR